MFIWKVKLTMNCNKKNVLILYFEKRAHSTSSFWLEFNSFFLFHKKYFIFITKQNTKCKIYSEVSKVVKLKKSERFYVGIIDSNLHGNWTFFNGRPANNLLYNWGIGQPDKNGNKKRKCTDIFQNKFEVKMCHWKLYTVCQVHSGKCWSFS